MHHTALLKLFSRPDPALFKKSFKTYRSCKEGENNDIVAIPAKDISTVVAMIPDRLRGAEFYYAVYKPGETAGILTGDNETEME
jgi:hypothetical protein